MSEHMPSPWEFWHNEKGGWSIKGQSHEVICQRNDWDHQAAESIANGRLMAAAPEVLVALKEAVLCLKIEAKMRCPEWDGISTDYSAIGKAERAIAKAEGGQR